MILRNLSNCFILEDSINLGINLMSKTIVFHFFFMEIKYKL